MHDRELLSQSAEETRRIGQALAQQLKPGDCLVLIGNLGAGKTTLVQGLAEGLGISESVVSPTFTLMREYQGRLPLYHVDAYRIKHLDELREIGLEDTMLAEGIVAIEWGEKAQELLPSGCIEISIDLLSDQYRKIRIRHPA
ncbi:tRNA (adenosine(37)-N6)-threonylcarbamoyltransferase complex ATPase subunit type 1 TsaE [Candidatus Acetothermia bacterium]|nr:tRNA (adenosine(37)-N6)-threonylcarbamoyltransferase complex ATPase subunit type 1 TsaE [Candidatus Acetothermia bacterium]